MPTNRSLHADVRAKQRGIPPFIEELLDTYGSELFDGNGTRTVYLTKKSFRRMERDLGGQIARKLTEWRNVYKIEDSGSGRIITIGHRYQRIWRR